MRRQRRWRMTVVTTFLFPKLTRNENFVCSTYITGSIELDSFFVALLVCFSHFKQLFSHRLIAPTRTHTHTQWAVIVILYNRTFYCPFANIYRKCKTIKSNQFARIETCGFFSLALLSSLFLFETAVCVRPTVSNSQQSIHYSSLVQRSGCWKTILRVLE